MDKVNFSDKFKKFDTIWTPKIVAESNGQLIKIAKGSGELEWHFHKNEDELFYVFEGELTIQLRNRDIVLSPGEMFVVPKGVEHCPKAKPNTHFMMMEPASTKHLGETESNHAISVEDQEWI